MSLASTRLRIWGSGVRISLGAPSITHLRTPSLSALAGQDSLFEQVLPALDPDPRVVDLDDINDRPDVGLPERYGPHGEVLLHHSTKSFDQGGIDVYLWCQLLLHTLQCSLRVIAFRLECVQSTLEHFIQVCHAIFDEAVKTLELFLGISHFPLQRHHTAVETFRVLGAPPSQ